MVMICDCEAVNRKIKNYEYDFKELEEQLDKCERCCYRKEHEKSKINLDTYLKARITYVSRFWDNISKRMDKAS